MKGDNTNLRCQYSGLPSPSAYSDDYIDYDSIGNQRRFPKKKEKSKMGKRLFNKLMIFNIIRNLGKKKNKLFIIQFIIMSTLTSQTSIDTNSIVSYVSPNRDTLYLANNDFGQTIYRTWTQVPSEDKPIILFKDIHWIIEENLKRRR